MRVVWDSPMEYILLIDKCSWACTQTDNPWANMSWACCLHSKILVVIVQYKTNHIRVILSHACSSWKRHFLSFQYISLTAGVAVCWNGTSFMSYAVPATRSMGLLRTLKNFSQLLIFRVANPCSCPPDDLYEKSKFRLDHFLELFIKVHICYT